MSHETEHHVHESPFSMTGVLIVLAILSAIGGFVSIPHFLEPLLPMPTAQEALEHYETSLIVLSVVLAVVGLAGAVFVYRGGLARADALPPLPPAPPLRRQVLWTNSTIPCSGRCTGSRTASSRDRRPVLIDGSLNGMRRSRSRRGRLSRVETGSLQLYVLFAVLGVITCLRGCGNG
jgi:NADH-quinone oxidoreductase subunit L